MCCCCLYWCSTGRGAGGAGCTCARFGGAEGRLDSALLACSAWPRGVPVPCALAGSPSLRALGERLRSIRLAR
eukprot:4610347-Amphidinium_carterae.1